MKVGINSKEKARRFLDDLAVVREHFGLTNSEAGRVAMHLTANAIRADKALPVVK